LRPKLKAVEEEASEDPTATAEGELEKGKWREKLGTPYLKNAERRTVLKVNSTKVKKAGWLERKNSRGPGGAKQRKSARDGRGETEVPKGKGRAVSERQRMGRPHRESRPQAKEGGKAGGGTAGGLKREVQRKKRRHFPVEGRDKRTEVRCTCWGLVGPMVRSGETHRS